MENKSKKEWRIMGRHPMLPVIFAYGDTQEEAWKDADRQVAEFVESHPDQPSNPSPDTDSVSVAATTEQEIDKPSKSKKTN